MPIAIVRGATANGASGCGENKCLPLSRRGTMWQRAVMTRPCEMEVDSQRSGSRLEVHSELRVSCRNGATGSFSCTCTKKMCRPSLAVKDLELEEAVGYQPKCSSKSVVPHFGVRGGRIINCVYVVCRHCTNGNGERGDGA